MPVLTLERAELEEERVPTTRPAEDELRREELVPTLERVVCPALEYERREFEE